MFETKLSPTEVTPVIKVKYHNKNIPKLQKIAKGDWIDVYAAEPKVLDVGEFALISLGISVQLPKGYEAHLAPRSSTYKKWNIIQTNSVGVVDESYCGENDVWKMPVMATARTVIHEGDKIAQFRIVEKMPEVAIVEVDSLENEDRGGFGSTGSR